MSRSFRFAMCVLFGTDMTLGLILYTIVTLMFHEHWSLGALGWAIFAAHMPDVDFAPFLMVRKKLAYSSHWLVGHHFLIALPLYTAIGACVGHKLGQRGYYFGTMTFAGVLAHFIHDGLQPQGMHWFSPFSWRRWTLGGIIPREVPRGVWLPIMQKLHPAEDAADTAVNELTKRAEPINALHILAWMAAVYAAVQIALFRP